MAPDPVKTRWNSWFMAVQYNNKHYAAYKGFIEAENQVCSQPPQSVLTLSEILGDEQKLLILQSQLKFVSEMCEPILNTLSQFESQRPCTLMAYDRLEELLISFEADALTVQVMDKFHENCDDLELDKRAQNLEIFKTAFEGTAEKLHKYVSETENGQTKGSAYFRPCTCVCIKPSITGL
jgi:hypothetical protein